MSGPHERMVGRDAELVRLELGVRDAVNGRGSLWLFTGEPGIGKSRLAEETERLARDAGFACAWGRSWESGGAPAFWPWAQVVRALEHAVALEHDAREERLLASLFPSREASIDAASTRFELFDAVASWLSTLSRSQPVWIGLEDLHAADAASLALLEALVLPLRSARVMVVGTVRDEAMTANASSAVYRRIARQARTLALTRLSEDSARALLTHALASSDESAIAQALDATGGLPLFVVELVRLAQAAPKETPLHALIPGSVESVLRQRLEGLAPACLEVLGWSALVGMDFDRELLAAVFDEAVVNDTLDAAVRASLLRRIGPRSHRLSHAILRDVLVETLDPAAQERAHASLAVALTARGASDAMRAHHWLRAGPEHQEQAVGTFLGATRDGLRRFAFEDALVHLATVREHLGGDPPPALEARMAVLEGLALVGLGRAEDGQTACLRGAELARAANDAELLAEAVLAYGSVYRFATVDTRLVALLEQALDRLPPTDSPLRAQLLARLAAARQPDPLPSRPMELARMAIAMAERVGDVAVQVATLRAGCSALVDMAHPRERRALDQRHLDLALREQLFTDELQARQRLLFDCFELGDFASAEGHVDRVLQLADKDAHPQHRWRAPALHILRRLWAGELSGIRALIEQVERLGAVCGDANATLAATFQLGRFIELSGNHEEASAVIARLERAFTGSELGVALAKVAQAHFLLQLGRAEEGVAAVAPERVVAVLDGGDRTSWLGIARWATATGDRALGQRLIARLADEDGLFVSEGVVGMAWRAPLALVLAHAAEAAGEMGRGLAWAEQAAAAARAAGGAPAAAEAHLQAMTLASALGQDDAAAAHRGRALAIIERLGLDGLRRRLAEGRPTAQTPPRPVAAPIVATATTPTTPTTERVALPVFTQEGELWTVRWRGRETRLHATKGLAVIAELVAHPREALHVLDLTHTKGPRQPVDRGDAGELIDASARDAYRARLRDLREALEEAEELHDLGRMEKAAAEIAFLEGELARGAGLSGRGRRSPGAEERARQAIRKQVRAALDRLSEADPELARYLDRAIRTGRTCVFEP